jgi:hypothetical protein
MYTQTFDIHNISCTYLRNKNAVDAQVDQVLTELTMGILGTVAVAPAVVPQTKEQLAETGKVLLRESLAEDAGDERDDVATESLQKRLAMLHA